MAPALHGRFHPDVIAFQAATFRLAEDLADLEGVAQVQAHTAVLFYAARILEGLAADALRRLGLAPPGSVFSALETLHRLDLLRPAERTWAHALRRLGNQARHLQRHVEPADATLAYHLLERWLDWFFRRYPLGPRLPGLTPAGERCWPELDPGIGRLMAELEQEGPGLPALAQAPALTQAPTLPAVLAELLLDRDAADAAAAVLDQAQARFPDDPRLRQLRGLWLSRAGRLEEALHVLRPLAAADPQDEETVGILAGVYKRCAAQGSGRPWLERAYRSYRQGWRLQRANTYLGINAAATAFWLGEPPAAEIAAAVRRELEARAATLAAPGRAGLSLGLWDQLALAEAFLIEGRLDQARHHYARARRDHPHQAGSLAVGFDQLRRHLRHLGLPDDPEAFLRGAVPSATS
jgi:tetratricopeptide (TPR) repeat protein